MILEKKKKRTELKEKGLELADETPTLLPCAGGQSSSRTPNVTPGDCFFSNGFLISPGMPFLHVPRSLGGLVSSLGRHGNGSGQLTHTAGPLPASRL